MRQRAQLQRCPVAKGLLQRDGMLARYMLLSVCPSVPSVHLSVTSGVLWKNLNTSSHKQHHMVTYRDGSYFMTPKMVKSQRRRQIRVGLDGPSRSEVSSRNWNCSTGRSIDLSMRPPVIACVERTVRVKLVDSLKLWQTSLRTSIQLCLNGHQHHETNNDSRTDTPVYFTV